MNERIQELAEEHGFIHEFMTTGERNDALQKYKKFAQLIVRETASIDFRHKVGMTTDQEFETGRVILEHFGVDE